MLQVKETISITDFDEGLNTKSNFLQPGNENQSPDCIDVKWNFDGSIQKRLGTSTMNTTALDNTAGWASFDFGATDVRWYVVAHGTGISASSNGGHTFVNVETDRTQTWQHFERSKNVLVATSDTRTDSTIYWAGSVDTQFAPLAVNSAPAAKFSINFDGFLVLLNTVDSAGAIRPRGFYYADEDTQLTDDWTDFFEFPSSLDDEITGAFVLAKRLYVTTKFKIFRVTFVGGNPDWSFLEIKDWGFVPRTFKKVTLPEVGEVVIGLDWNRRLRVFDGVDDTLGSDNVENDNGMAVFAMNNISFTGSGLLVSHAELDRNEQEYRLNLALGDSSETTHALLMNGRIGAFYPYSNQNFQSTIMIDSGGRLYLMGCDRDGRVHVINSGNRDVATAISDHYDSPFLYNKVPGELSKGRKVDLYFSQTSSGTIFVEDRADFNSLYSPRAQFELTTANSENLLVRSFDTPSTHNVYQFRISSSSNTADPWKLTRSDYFKTTHGIGKGAR